jgi:RNA polymerase sigma-70 factor (ECF subfamily)
LNCDDLDGRDIASCLAGDRQAFAGLVQRHQGSALRLAHQLLENAEAEDIVQEAFLRAWRALPGLRQPGSFRFWLLRTTANLCRDALRRRRPVLALCEEQVLSTAPGPDEVHRVHELRDLTARALRALPPDYRMLLLLRYSEGMSYRELAVTTGLPLTVVKNRLYRARLKMQEAVARGVRAAEVFT